MAENPLNNYWPSITPFLNNNLFITNGCNSSFFIIKTRLLETAGTAEEVDIEIAEDDVYVK